jgi:kumamolisin
VIGWLTSQGFTITKTDPNHLGVFVAGTVRQVQQALQVNFGRVLVANNVYVSAVTAPSVPASLAPLMVGVNGLQPHIKAHKHTQRVPVQSTRITLTAGGLASPSPQTANRPPFLVDEILKAYNANGLPLSGSGEKIAIVIDTFPNDSDLTSFWAINGLNQDLSHIEKVQVASGTLPAPTGEETLDVEWSSGIAESATVRIYATTDLSLTNIDQALQAILNDIPIEPELHQVSISLGLGESFVSPSQLQTDAQYFASMAANGLTVFVSSGDSGSSEGGITQVSYFASDPSVTAVGGTSLTLSSASGIATNETVWHGSGGGISSVFARPFWQTGVGVPSGSTRLVPDVASAADPNTGGLVILNGQQTQFGGTSWSAPMWAGFCALINQARANVALPPAALLGPKIYPLLRTTAFRDITTGNNGAFSARLGYDLCTGVGVPDIAVLLQPLTGGPIPPPAPTPPHFGEIVDPPPGSTLQSTTVTFSWNAGDATAYWLTVGDETVPEPGGSNILSSGQTGGHFYIVSNLPTDGRTINVRLWSNFGGAWFGPPQEYTYTAVAANVVAPVITPRSGTYKGKVIVSMATATPGATIRYTLDGSIPTTNSILYQSPFAITNKGTTTVRATAFKAGAPDSPSVAATYTITRKRRR